MKAKLMGAITLAVLLLLVFAAVAQAAVSQATIDKIIADAQDNGKIDGNWTAAEIRAALKFVENNPLMEQYSQVKGVLEDYLASLQDPGEQGGSLAFTGGEIFLILGAGAGLIGSGALLRRRRA
jgi:hypothetical protein